MQFTTGLRNSRLAAIATAVGSGGTINVYTGAPPGVGNAPTGTLLATLTALSLGAPAAGAMAVSATPATAAVTGTPGYWRFVTSGGVAVVEGPAGVGSGELDFGNTVTSGGQVSLVSGTLTEGNA
jgi:hypothetical protein